MILGLDVSTSITGITLLSEDGKMLVNKCVNTKNKEKYPTVLKVADAIEEGLREIEIEDVRYVFIEPPLLSFKTGFSSATTLSLLSKINGIVSYIAYRKYRIEPEYFEARSARKICGITIEKGADAKARVVEEVKKLEPDFVIEYTKEGNLKAGTADRADSYVQALAGLRELRRKNVI